MLLAAMQSSGCRQLITHIHTAAIPLVALSDKINAYTITMRSVIHTKEREKHLHICICLRLAFECNIMHSDI